MNENIFTELYNKILSLFGQQTQKEESKNVAVNRLRVVLMQDRTNLTPEILQRMRQELIELLSKYLEMDKDALELNLEQEGEQMALMLSIPVIRAKDEEEIQAAIKAQEEAKKAEKEEAEESEEEASDDETSDEDAAEESEEEDISEEDEEIEKSEENAEETSDDSDEEAAADEEGENLQESEDAGKDEKTSKEDK